jgi:hypothetical protein
MRTEHQPVREIAGICHSAQEMLSPKLIDLGGKRPFDGSTWSRAKYMKQHIADLATGFRETESDDSRGPLFKAVALAIEEEMKSGSITKEDVVECFGPPDRFGDDVFVYVFDHVQSGRNNDEWYFHFDGSHLCDSGFNIRGINDLSQLKSGNQFAGDA